MQPSMVFSQASRKACSALKVVDLDRLTRRALPVTNGGGGVVPGYGSSPRASTSRASPEEYLKTNQEYGSAMYRNLDFEFFQDLDLLCCDPVKEGPAQITDFTEQHKHKTNTDTPHTKYIDANSPMAPSPPGPASPLDEYPRLDTLHEQFQDIISMPVDIGELADGQAFAAWTDTHTYTPHTSPFIDQEDSLDLKLGAAMPRDIEFNDDVISEWLGAGQEAGLAAGPPGPRARPPLALDVAARAADVGPVISTPDVVNYVEQLEAKDAQFELTDLDDWPPAPAADPDYQPITPKSESDDEAPPPRKRRRNSDSDDYTPYQEKAPRKYKRRKDMPIQEMIQVLEESQPLTKARRGRPPKRRDSAVSSACSVDTTLSAHEHKYREIRDKNNEASKRSRVNRKLKELQTEQLALDLEERNAKLRVQAGILEDMTKRLKDALMSAILKP